MSAAAALGTAVLRVDYKTKQWMKVAQYIRASLQQCSLPVHYKVHPNNIYENENRGDVETMILNDINLKPEIQIQDLLYFASLMLTFKIIRILFWPQNKQTHL